jgi:hypothetical protein
MKLCIILLHVLHFLRSVVSIVNSANRPWANFASQKVKFHF